jgi:acyl transferase domain-containing protein/NADPH:quinone reductase-like Zn-dependent oxidoreductase/SAM-dependent methyltransferase
LAFLYSFGYGGTNAHVIVEKAKGLTFPEQKQTPSTESDARPRVFVISGASEKSCQKFASNLAEFVTENAATDSDNEWMDQLAYTLNKRKIHQHRAIIAAATPEALVEELKTISTKPEPVAPGPDDEPTRVAYVFSGQGAQYYNMGRELIHVWPQFTESLSRFNRSIRRLGCTWDVFEELQRDAAESRLDEPRYGQPLSTAIQMALVDTMASLNIKPKAVAGHSSGEIAGAYAAGYLSFDNAVLASYHRGRLTSDLLERGTDIQGAMLAVGAASGVVEEYIARLGGDSDRVIVACYNSPASVTVSGDLPVIEQLSELLEKASVFNRILRTKGAAYHSDQMRLIEEEYREALQPLEVLDTPTSVIMVSSSTGSPIEDAQELGPDYWVNNLVSPVYFEDALWGLLQAEDGTATIDVVVELGAHSQLEGPVKQTIQSFKGEDIKYVSALKRKSNAAEALLVCLGHLFGQGINLDLHHANSGFQRALPSLLASAPSYAFDHGNTYWHEGRVSKAYTQRQLLPHELIGNLAIDANSLEPRWRRFLNIKELPWLQNHIVQGQCVFPAAGYLAMAVEGMRRHKLASDSAGEEILSYNLHSITIGKALIIDQDSIDHEICLSMRPEPRSARNSSGVWMEFRIFTVSSTQEWIEHCRGLISVTTANASPQSGSLKRKGLTDQSVFQSEVQPAVRESPESVSPNKFYFLSRDVGLDWSAPFNNLVGIKLGADTSVCTVQCPEVSTRDSRGGAKYVMHPATLDAALFHGLCAVVLLKNKLKSPAVPTFIQDLFISANFSEAQGVHLNCYSARRNGPMTFDVDVSVGSGDAEQVVIRAEGITATPLPGDIALNSSRELIHSLDWVTYTGELDPAYVDAHYKSAIAPKSVAEHNKNLDALVMFYIQAALKNTTVDQVPEDYRRRWFAWMQSKVIGSVDASLPARDAFDDVLDGEYETLTTLGRNLTGILTGKIEPLDLLMKSGLVSSLYSNERCQRCYEQMAAYCSDLAAENPGMRVLEIGAGTGSASEAMLEALCPEGNNGTISRYEFTDISPGFFESAKTRLSKFSSVVNYRTLDVEKDIAGQGLEEGSFDLVIACNVIHATSSIGRSLDQVRALLRPGGTLLLMEITKEALYYNMTFGSFPGWWVGDVEGRVTSPLITEPEWETMLTAHKFNKPVAYFRDYEEAMGGTVSVMVSTAAPAEPEPMTHLIEVVHDRSKPSEIPGLADALKASLGFENVSSKELGATCTSYAVSVFLPEVCESFIDDVTPEAWNSFKNRLLSSEAVLFLTRGASRDSKRPRGAMLAGLARSFRVEHQDIRVINLDFDLETSAEACCDFVVKVLQGPSFDRKMADADVEHEFAESRGQLYVPRAFHQKEIENGVLAQRNMSKPVMRPFLDDSGRTLLAEAEVPGLLDTLRWRDDLNAGPPGPDEIQFELRAASINFKDVLIAAGQLEGVTEMKNDCGGIVTEVGANMKGRFKPGDRVCAYYSRSYTNRPRVHGDACALIPDHLSFEEAASLPIVWGTVYYSLIDQGHLQRGESVLIHSAAGAVGQAAIILSQHLGAEAFVTVSSNEKRDFLMKTYGIPEDHIFSSRTTGFGRSIRAMTPNEGVDVVLNSLGGDVFRESCNTLAPYGRFVEIGRKEFLDDMLMPVKFLLKNITFSYVDLALLIDDKKPLARRVLEDVMDLMSRQAVRPTSIMTMPISEIEAAFRLIQAGKHIGKVILTVSDGQLAKVRFRHRICSLTLVSIIEYADF